MFISIEKKSIMDVSVITCDEAIDSYDERLILMKRKQSVKHRSSIFYLLFLIPLSLLVVACIYSYLIKYQGKHLLPFHNTNNKSNKFYIDSMNWKIKTQKTAHTTCLMIL